MGDIYVGGLVESQSESVFMDSSEGELGVDMLHHDSKSTRIPKNRGERFGDDSVHLIQAVEEEVAGSIATDTRAGAWDGRYIKVGWFLIERL